MVEKKELIVGEEIQSFWFNFIERFEESNIFKVTHEEAASYVRAEKYRDKRTQKPVNPNNLILSGHLQKKVHSSLMEKLKETFQNAPLEYQRAEKSLEDSFINPEKANVIAESYISHTLENFNNLLNKSADNHYFKEDIEDTIKKLSEALKKIQEPDFYKTHQSQKDLVSKLIDVNSSILEVSNTMSRVMSQMKFSEDDNDAERRELKESRNQVRKAHDYIQGLVNSVNKLSTPSKKKNEALQKNILKIKDLFEKLKDKKPNELKKHEQELLEQIIHHIIYEHPLMGTKMEPLIQNGEIVKYEALLTGEMLYQDPLLSQLIQDNGKFMDILNETTYLKTLNIDLTIQHVFNSVYLNENKSFENLERKGNIKFPMKSSINISELELKDPHFIETLQKLQLDLKTKNRDKEDKDKYELKDIISFEFLEHSFDLLDNKYEELSPENEEILKNIKWIQKQGIELGIDDYGEGKSDMNRVENMTNLNIEPNYIKVDANIMSAIYLEELIVNEDWKREGYHKDFQESNKQNTISKHLENLLKNHLSEKDSKEMAQKILYKENNKEIWKDSLDSKFYMTIIERANEEISNKTGNNINLHDTIKSLRDKNTDLIKYSKENEKTLIYEHVDAILIKEDLMKKGHILQGYQFKSMNIHPSIDLAEKINMSDVNEYIYNNENGFKNTDRRNKEEYVTEELSKKNTKRRKIDTPSQVQTKQKQ